MTRGKARAIILPDGTLHPVRRSIGERCVKFTKVYAKTIQAAAQIVAVLAAILSFS